MIFLGVFMVIPFHFAQLSYLIIFAVILAGLILYRLTLYAPTVYRYSLVNFIAQNRLAASFVPVQFFFWVRLLALFLMLILIGKPQLVDTKSKLLVNGIDIVLALDVSGSMELFDDAQDRRTRIDVAKKEAENFIDKRINDAIGVVVFGRYAFASCPITFDKGILKSIVSQIQIGKPSDDMRMMTMISQGLITAALRLQNSQAKSKIIVLLTDGAPSPGDLPIEDAIAIAKEIGIKVYTIGVGGDQGGLMVHPLAGLWRVDTPLNKPLLKKIAQETGGQFFEAKNPKDLAHIYDKIDRLEKTKAESEIYHNYQDYFLPILWIVIALTLLELLVATWVWFIL
ncbi:VWA domain-containing protein [Candidatus Dependentiae bacterium]|nr:VWA domain-containing protein [Candidatus Dependentiae bacterium]